MNRLYALFGKICEDSLYRNAFFLSASTFVMAGIGFFFWMICTRYYTPEQIGLATTLISLTSLITSFSMFGLNTAIVRFLPSAKDKNALVNTAFGVIILSTIVVTMIVLAGLPWISPKLAFIRNYPLFEVSLIIFMIVASLNGITDSIFIAHRKTEYILSISTIMSLVKLATPILFVSLGTYGIFYGFMTSINVALVLSVLSLVAFFNYRFHPRINTEEVQKMWKFSFGTYMAGVIGMLYATITPILITNKLGPAMTAYYFMPSMIIVLVQSIARSLASSMTAEGSYASEDLRPLFFRSLKASFLIITPLVLALIFFGTYILSVFGKSYSGEGIVYLRLALVSCLIAIPNAFFSTILYIKKQVKLIVIINTVSTVIGLILLSQLLRFGLSGVAYAGIATHILLIGIYLLFVFRKKFNSAY